MSIVLKGPISYREKIRADSNATYSRLFRDALSTLSTDSPKNTVQSAFDRLALEQWLRD